jgi:hypothetical protein
MQNSLLCKNEYLYKTSVFDVLKEIFHTHICLKCSVKTWTNFPKLVPYFTDYETDSKYLKYFKKPVHNYKTEQYHKPQDHRPVSDTVRTIATSTF